MSWRSAADIFWCLGIPAGRGWAWGRHCLLIISSHQCEKVSCKANRHRLLFVLLRTLLWEHETSGGCSCGPEQIHLNPSCPSLWLEQPTHSWPLRINTNVQLAFIQRETCRSLQITQPLCSKRVLSVMRTVRSVSSVSFPTFRHKAVKVYSWFTCPTVKKIPTWAPNPPLDWLQRNVCTSFLWHSSRFPHM